MSFSSRSTVISSEDNVPQGENYLREEEEHVGETDNVRSLDFFTHVCEVEVFKRQALRIITTLRRYQRRLNEELDVSGTHVTKSLVHKGTVDDHTNVWIMVKRVTRRVELLKHLRSVVIAKIKVLKNSLDEGGVAGGGTPTKAAMLTVGESAGRINSRGNVSSVGPQQLAMVEKSSSLTTMATPSPSPPPLSSQQKEFFLKEKDKANLLIGKIDEVCLEFQNVETHVMRTLCRLPVEKKL